MKNYLLNQENSLRKTETDIAVTKQKKQPCSDCFTLLFLNIPTT